MAPTGETSEEEQTEARLHQLAVRHGVRYEVLPAQEMVGSRVARVGFDLQLYGLHEHPEGVRPGCSECSKVYHALHEIAEWMLPSDQRPSRYEIGGFDHDLHSAPDIKDRDEVRLDVRILHRHDYFAPIDKCEERCLSDMKQKLRRLGVREGGRRSGQPSI